MTFSQIHSVYIDVRHEFFPFKKKLKVVHSGGNSYERKTTKTKITKISVLVYLLSRIGDLSLVSLQPNLGQKK